MDAYSLTRANVGMFAAAVGNQRRLFISIVFGVNVKRLALELHVERPSPADSCSSRIEIQGDRLPQSASPTLLASC